MLPEPLDIEEVKALPIGSIIISTRDEVFRKVRLFSTHLEVEREDPWEGIQRTPGTLRVVREPSYMFSGARLVHIPTSPDTKEA